MKKTLCIVMCLIMVISLSACGKSDEEKMAELREKAWTADSKEELEDVAKEYDKLAQNVSEKKEDEKQKKLDEISKIEWKHYECDERLLSGFNVHDARIVEYGNKESSIAVLDNNSFYVQIDDMVFDILNGFTYQELLNQINNSSESNEYALYSGEFSDKGNQLADNNELVGDFKRITLAKYGIAYAEFMFWNKTDNPVPMTETVCTDIYGTLPNCYYLDDISSYDIYELDGYNVNFDNGTQSISEFSIDCHTYDNNHLYENMYYMGGFRADGYYYDGSRITYENINDYFNKFGFPNYISNDSLAHNAHGEAIAYPFYCIGQLHQGIGFSNFAYGDVNIDEEGSLRASKKINLGLTIDEVSHDCRFIDLNWDANMLDFNNGLLFSWMELEKVYLDGDLIYEKPPLS